MTTKRLVVDGLELNYDGMFSLKSLLDNIDKSLSSRGYAKNEKRRTEKVSEDKKNLWDSAMDAVEGAADKAKNLGGEAIEKVEDIGEAVADKVGAAAEEVAQKVGDAKDVVLSKTKDAAHKVGDALRDAAKDDDKA